MTAPTTPPPRPEAATGRDWLQKIQHAAALHARGELNGARAAYLELLVAHPDNPHIAKLLGRLEQDAGQLPMAARLLQLSLYLQADFNTAMQLAELQLQQDDPTAARASLEVAVALQADSLAAHHLLAITLDRLGEHAAALAPQARAVVLAPNNANLRYNLGRVLHALGRYDEAADAYAQALALNPRFTAAAFNRGNSLHQALRLPESIASFDLALSLQPDDANFHWAKALAALLHGDYRSGWHHYERRWHRDGGEVQRQFSVPQWSGQESIRGKTLLIHCEQGLGDVIQFSRYALDVIARGGRVVIGAPQTLHPLLRSMHPAIKTIIAHAEHPDFDFHCPVMSLPHAFSTTLQTVPAPCPYMGANAALVADWERALGPRLRPRLGLVWFGNPKHLHDHRRSVALDTLLPVLGLPLDWHSLQQDSRAQDQARLAHLPDLGLHGPALADFAHTAALIACMDLVVTVDTSIAHLAGALGKPVWILLHHVPDYRWLLLRHDSPWYPSARLFRQRTAGDWDTVVAELRLALSTHFGLAATKHTGE